MKERFDRQPKFWPSLKATLFLNLSLVICAITASAQTASSSDADLMQRRIARARALAAAHNLVAAASELDAIRNSTTDDSVRDVARVMLIGIHLEQGDYGRAQSLLEETFKMRLPQDERSCRSYFAVAGQAVNGVRSHLARYRAFGLNIADKDLPADAVNDLDRLRTFIEHIAGQAKQIGAEDGKNTDAFALLEDVANVRARLSRDDEDHLRWQGEMSEARQRLTGSNTRIVVASGTAGTTSSSPAVAGSKSISAPISVPAATPSSSSTQNSTEKTTKAGIALPGSSQVDQHINVGSLLDKAAQKVAATYPRFARNARVTGIVRVDLLIDEKGSVVSVRSTAGPELLRQAAIDAAMRWKFHPTIRDGQPVRVQGFLNFNFTL